MRLRFYHDPETAQPHIYNHGVTEREVAEVLRSPGEDMRAAKDRAARSDKRRPADACKSSTCRIRIPPAYS